MGAFQVHTRAPAVSFKLSELAPPQEFYIPPGHALMVQSWSSYSTLPVDIRATVLLPDGTISTTAELHQAAADRTGVTQTIPLPEGFLLGLVCSLAGQAVAPGRIWMAVTLGRGTPPPQPLGVQTLITGWVGGQSLLIWPRGPGATPRDGGGWVRTVVGTDPAAGNEISEAVPTNALWRLLGVYCTLVTDATVANRTPALVIDDGSNIVWRGPWTVAQTASSTNNYSIGNSMPAQVWYASTGLLPLPTILLLPAGYRIRTVTANLQAGDNWGAPNLWVEEYLTL
jgi:hypothetical protein